MKRIAYSKAPAHIRSAIREAAREGRWETTDEVPLVDLLDQPNEKKEDES